ncbi:hypothetical protein KUTeg_002184 [Tegillarca granosa]|uniref:Uncharacterized protein n=1 Tax=Tegillarca granosa TaxID=220873 RepID=A0ABQ9FV00_TEGGR|nr:hypothetical protein KUTeg_002184 [Tegillarca granosa]
MFYNIFHLKNYIKIPPIQVNTYHPNLKITTPEKALVWKIENLTPLVEMSPCIMKRVQVLKQTERKKIGDF